MIEQLMPYVDELVETLKSATQFAMEQLPGVVQEALAFWTVMAALQFWMSAILFLVLGGTAVWLIAKDVFDDFEVSFTVGIILAGISLASFIWLLLGTLSNYVMAITAPKLFLLTKLADLIGGN